MAAPWESAAALLRRGFACGAAIGFVCGFFVLASAAFVHDPEFGVYLLYFLVPFGLVSATIGALYGGVAGILVAVAIAPIVGRPWASAAARLLGLVVGTLVVVVMSTVLFRPSLEPGPNETQDHVRERVELFYAVPGAMAAGAGTLLTPRLLTGRVTDDRPRRRGLRVAATKRRRGPA